MAGAPSEPLATTAAASPIVVIDPVVTSAEPIRNVPLLEPSREQHPNREQVAVESSDPTVVRIVEREIVREPPLEPIVEVQLVPGPVMVVERPVHADRSRSRPRPAERSVRSAPDGPRVRRVLFDGGEPLERRGVDRLEDREVTEHPAIQGALAGDQVDSTIHVHIGRLEVQRPAPPTAPPRPPRPRAPVLGLADYLADRPTIRSGR